ncbi:MAG: DUF4159 domain-containing protein [Phycisphaeraceae bacterium]
MSSRRAILFALAVVVASIVPLSLGEEDEKKAAPQPPQPGEVRVAKLTYANGKTTVCFAEGFLATVARQTSIKVHRTLLTVDLASEDMFSYPFVIFSGEGSFSLGDKEKKNFKDYVNRGGFVLASAGCSNAAWSLSFEAALKELFPDAKLSKADAKHPMFHTIYDIDHLVPKKVTDDPVLYVLEREGKVLLVYTPLGLNDTGNAGGGCCCCGGNELRDASLINANLLAYALTR